MGSGKRKYNHRVKYIPKEKKLTMPKKENKDPPNKEDVEKLIALFGKK